MGGGRSRKTPSNLLVGSGARIQHTYWWAGLPFPRKTFVEASVKRRRKGERGNAPMKVTCSHEEAVAPPENVWVVQSLMLVVRLVRPPGPVAT